MEVKALDEQMQRAFSNMKTGSNAGNDPPWGKSTGYEYGAAESGGTGDSAGERNKGAGTV